MLELLLHIGLERSELPLKRIDLLLQGSYCFLVPLVGLVHNRLVLRDHLLNPPHCVLVPLVGLVHNHLVLRAHLVNPPLKHLDSLNIVVMRLLLGLSFSSCETIPKVLDCDGVGLGLQDQPLEGLVAVERTELVPLGE